MTIQPEFARFKPTAFGYGWPRRNGTAGRAGARLAGELVLRRHRSRPLPKRAIASPRLMSVATAAATSQPRSSPTRSRRCAPTSRGSSKVSASGRQFWSATIGVLPLSGTLRCSFRKGFGRSPELASPMPEEGRSPHRAVSKHLQGPLSSISSISSNLVSRRPNLRPTCALPYGKSTIRLRAKAGRRHPDRPSRPTRNTSTVWWTRIRCRIGSRPATSTITPGNSQAVAFADRSTVTARPSSTSPSRRRLRSPDRATGGLCAGSLDRFSASSRGSTWSRACAST